MCSPQVLIDNALVRLAELEEPAEETLTFEFAMAFLLVPETSG